jgi:hypothetical protein
MRAGFFAAEPLSAVVDFLAALGSGSSAHGDDLPVSSSGLSGLSEGADERGSGGWVLMQPHPRTVFGEAELEASLSSLGLVPRASLVASPRDLQPNPQVSSHFHTLQQLSPFFSISSSLPPISPPSTLNRFHDCACACPHMCTRSRV